MINYHKGYNILTYSSKYNMFIEQVKSILYRRNFIYQFHRRFYNTKLLPEKTLYPLNSRGLLQISGEDPSTFLQGLITNDMRHFDSGAKSIYAMFLNNKGRVLYDTLIHKWDQDTFMIECDKNLLSVLTKHLKMFKLRRNIKIADVNNDFRVSVLATQDKSDLDTRVIKSVNIYKDPRLSDLGYRIISSKALEIAQVAQAIGTDVTLQNNEEGYQYLRYKLGVSEGGQDLPPATNFPLEANCDYLHGVSFHKGCYIGQEVTARVHHTGVVRKRIMPLKFKEPIQKNLEPDSIIIAENNPKNNLGKLKGVVGNYGLGLLRIKETFDAKIVSVQNYSAEPFRPSWWPVEAPKEIPKTNETIALKEQA